MVTRAANNCSQAGAGPWPENRLHQTTQKETEMQMYMIAPAIGMTVYVALIATVLIGG